MAAGKRRLPGDAARTATCPLPTRRRVRQTRSLRTDLGRIKDRASPDLRWDLMSTASSNQHGVHFNPQRQIKFLIR